MFGRVLDRDGAAVAGAQVTLFWTPSGDVLGSRTDRVDVATNARGRFVAELLPRVGYSAFALGARDTEYSCPASEVAEAIAAGGEVELRLTTSAEGRRITIRGDAAGLGAARPRVQAFVRARNVLGVEASVEGLAARTPLLPDVGTVLLRDDRGEPLWVAPAPAEMAFDLYLPSPRNVRFRAVDENGAPLGGVTIEQQLAPVAGRRHPLDSLVLPVTRRVATTDAKGEATAVIPAPADIGVAGSREILIFVACAPGRRIALAGFDNGWFQGTSWVPEAVGDCLEFVLRPAPRLQLRNGGMPLAGHGVTFSWRRTIGAGMRSMGRIAMSRAVTDAEGFAHVPLVEECEEAIVYPDAVPVTGSGRAAFAAFDLVPGAKDQIVDLASLRQVRIQMEDDTSGPAVGVPVVLLGHRRIPCLFAVRPAYTDRAGRVDLLVGPGGWLAFACDAERASWHSVASDAANVQELKLRQARAPRLRIRVVDDTGQPVVGAAMTFCGKRSTGADDRPEAKLLGELDQLMHSLHRGRVSGADGMLELPVLLEGGQPWSLTVGIGSRRSEVIDVTPNAEPVEVVVR